MPSRYNPDRYSKIHIEEVAEICNLRKYYGMPCRECTHEGLADCPEIYGVISNGGAKDTVKRLSTDRRK
jgi:hypothetical protein